MLAPLAPHFASEMWSAFVDNSAKCSNDFDWVKVFLKRIVVIFILFIQQFIIFLIYFKAKPVLEQSWPQVDMDYNLDLNCFINNQQVCTIKVPRCELDECNVSIAVQLLKQNESYVKYHRTKQILKTKFDHYPGVDATLYITTEQKEQTKN